MLSRFAIPKDFSYPDDNLSIYASVRLQSSTLECDRNTFDTFCLFMAAVYLDSFFKLHYEPGAKLTDGIDPELWSLVHPHWKTFPPQHPFILDVFGVFLFLSWIASSIGNILVLYLSLVSKERKKANDYFVMNLAISDLCMANSQNLCVAINIFKSEFFMYGAEFCKWYGALGGLFGTVSLLTMVAIGFDRYNSIARGVATAKISESEAMYAIALTWIYSFCCVAPPFFGWGSYALEGMLMTCSYDYLTDDWNRKSFVGYGFFVHYLIPVSMVLYFYFQIVKAVIHHEANLKEQARRMNKETLRVSDERRKQKAEIRIAKVAIVNVMIWIIAYTPYALVVFMGTMGYLEYLTPIVSQLPAFFLKFSSCFNPIVFALGHPKFKKAMKKHLGCKKRRREGLGSNETVVTAMPMLLRCMSPQRDQR